MIRVTADSNVYISALVFGGKPLRVVELATEGAIRLTISEPLIAETRRVLGTKFAWTDERTTGAIEALRSVTEEVTPAETLDVVPTDPDDNRVLECAVAGRAEFVVTGDGDLLVLQSFRGIPIVTVAVFLERFDAGQ